MRWILCLWVALVSSSPTFAQAKSPVTPAPGQFEIGRHSFFDFGPPSDFYDLFIVRPAASGTSIERISLTPPGDSCLQTAKVEVATATVSESIATILGNTNPCAIPEKKLHRELKRCKKCLVFSGAKIAMEVQCGSQTRIIRSDILDRDMFDPAAKTPEHTQWTMQLVQFLDKAVGPGVMDEPMFPVSESAEAPVKSTDPEALRDVGAGKYDALFPTAPDTPSDLYRASQTRPISPSIRLMSSAPLEPEVFVAPVYSPIARLGHIQGFVSFTIDTDFDGRVKNLIFDSGSPFLQTSVKKASSEWKFPQNPSALQIHAVIEFSLNCPQPPN